MITSLQAPLTYAPETGRFTRDGVDTGRWEDDGYLVIDYAGKQRRAHRLAWFLVYGVWPSMQLDHINGDTTERDPKS